MQRVLAFLLVALMTAPAIGAQQPASPDDVPCATNSALSEADESRARFFCEPMDSTFFIQFSQFEEGLAYLETHYPDYIEVKVIGESLGGRPVYFVEVTNENSTVPRDDKIQIGYSASIHANEPAGREGMSRMIEDLAAGIGPHGAALRPLLDDIILNVWFPNPDSWAQGDYFSSSEISGAHECSSGVVPLFGGPSVGYCSNYSRGNADGIDLNRQFPNPGLIHKDHAPMTQPESRAIVKELRFSGNHSSLVAGTDLHGMVSSENMMRMIIPNQDYDFRRMVLSVDQLRTIEERVDADPAFAEWKEAGSLGNLLGPAVGDAEDTVPQQVDDASPFGTPSAQETMREAVPSKPLEWGARWDMIGYTDTGFTSDYLMLSPRSPTGGMGAVGTITEFAYSHSIPDNKWVAKLADMHVAGVRQIVRAQMEMAGRLDTPVLTGTGPVGFLDDGSYVSSDEDKGRYEVGHAFDVEDQDTWFDFDQVEYNVTNLRFWRDLARFSEDPIVSVDAATFDGSQLADLDHFVITNQTYDALNTTDIAAIKQWVSDGGHLLVTDSALRFFDAAGLGGDAEQIGTYLGYSDVQTKDHPLMDDVTWEARVTAEGPAIGVSVGGPYPQWVLTTAPTGAQVVGTTQDKPSLGRVILDEGSIDFIGAALPMPKQVAGSNEDHRYGLADYSVSAFTYWIVMNSLGGAIEWQPIDSPFVPYYDFDPLHQAMAEPEPEGSDSEENTPGLGFVALLLMLGVALMARRKQT